MARGAPLPPCLLFGRVMRHQERAGNFLHVFQVCIHAFRQFTGRFQKLDVHKACRHGHFRRGADAQRHHRACPVGKEHGARIFRVAHAVIQQIPVQAVHPAVRVAGGATLPPLEAMGGIIKIPFPQFFPGRPGGRSGELPWICRHPSGRLPPENQKSSRPHKRFSHRRPRRAGRSRAARSG